MSEHDYDLIVIGSGPAGEKAATAAAFFGKRVALVEGSSRFAGAVGNTGVPGKGMRETSLYISGFRSRDLHGVTMEYNGDLHAEQLLHRGKSLRGALGGWVQENLERHGVDVIRGFASFTDPHTLRIQGKDEDRTIMGDYMMIATGSRPRRPECFPWDDDRIYDSNTILGMKRVPKDLLVVGGGTIGCEYACMFGALGVDVTVAHKSQELFEFADREIAQTLQDAISEMGVTMMLGESVQSVDNSGEQLKLILESGEIVEATTMLVALGRKSNVEKLSLENAGVEIDENGIPMVNEWFQTNVDHIYAAGDVIGFPALASTSMEQGRTAVVHAFDLDDVKLRHGPATVLPYGVWTIPEMSMVGETEESCREKGIRYVVGRAKYSDNPRGMLVGEPKGIVKLIYAHPTGRLVGAHIIGETACELIGIGLMGIVAGVTWEHFMKTCFNYPTLSDMYKYATYDALCQMERERKSNRRPNRESGTP